jgi:predicted phosphoribosyltransferase
VPLAGRTVVLVDDGIATGATMRAACLVARARGARWVVVAVPVGPPDIEDLLRPVADRVLCLDRPAAYFAVGQAYRRFTQTTDAEVAALLRRATGAPDDPTTPNWPIHGGAG